MPVPNDVQGPSSPVTPSHPKVHSSSSTSKRTRSFMTTGFSPGKHPKPSEEFGEMSSPRRQRKTSTKTMPTLSAKPRRSDIQGSLLQQRQNLPIWKGKQSLINAVIDHDTVVILGETGSGKTTQVPQFLLEAHINGEGIIGVTQPRRVAATSLATRVANEQGCPLGHRVGYSVRFDDKTNEDTRIKYLTDGMLVRELLSDPILSRYTIIIVDEAHERTLRTDMLLSALKRIQKERNSPVTPIDRKGKQPQNSSMIPLKVIIMSATLDAERFSQFFGKAPVLLVEGRQHTVQTYYTEDSQDDFVESALQTFFQIHLEQPTGDVLVFLPGQEQIDSLHKSIQIYERQIPSDKSRVLVCPLYAALPQSLQNRVFQPAPKGTRKVVLATNIAETSITIPGIRYVIDTGLCKEKHYIVSNHPGSGMDVLLLKPISRSSAQQRAGRAGREGPGICYRLYTEAAFRELRLAALPEILRCNLTFAVLQMKCLGQDILTGDFMDAPSPENIRHSQAVLLGLGALDYHGIITPLGQSMAAIPLDPPLARALIASKENACTLETIAILSLLSTSAKVLLESSAEQREAIVEARNKFRHPTGDHFTLLNVFRTYGDVLAGSTSSATRIANVNFDSDDESVDGRSTNLSGRLSAKEWCSQHFVNERAMKEAKDIAGQLAGSCKRMGIDPNISCGEDVDRVLRTLLTGMFQRCALLTENGTYRQISDKQTIKVFPASTLFGRKTPVIIYDELVYTSATYARTVSVVEKAWLLDLPAFQRRSA